MPLEIHDGMIDFAHGRHLLTHKVKPTLARIEGVAPGDDETGGILTKEEGLSLGDEGLSGLQRTLLSPFVHAVLNLKGDGSEAAFLLGKRLELPVDDRGLVILASQTAEFAIKKGEQWPTAALLRAATDTGVTFDHIEKRVRKGVGGLVGILSKLPFPGAQEGKEEADSKIEELLSELKKLWGDSTDSLRARKTELERTVVAAIDHNVSSNPPHHLAELRMDLADMKILTAGPFQGAIENAEHLLETIVSSHPELSLQQLTPLSALGTYLVMESVRTSLPFDRLPEEKSKLIDSIASEAAGLQSMDYEALASGDQGMREQVKKRTRILRGASRVIQSPKDLFDAADARRREVKTLKMRKGDKVPYYNPRPEAVAEVLSFYVNQTPELLTDDAKLGETFATAHAIVTESLTYLEKARDQAKWVLEGLNRPKESPNYVDAEVGRDLRGLTLLGLARPIPPETRVTVSPETRATLAATTQRIPDMWTINSLARTTLMEIASGEKLPKGTTLEKEYGVLSTLIQANLRPG